MAKRGFGYFDRKGQYFRTAAEATQSDIAALLDNGDAGASNVAKLICEHRKEIDAIFTEHDDMVSQDGPGRNRQGSYDDTGRSSDVAPSEAAADSQQERFDPLRQKPKSADNSALDTFAQAKALVSAFPDPTTSDRPAGERSSSVSEEGLRGPGEGAIEPTTVLQLENADLATNEDGPDGREPGGQEVSDDHDESGLLSINGTGASLTDLGRRLAKRPARLS